MLDPRRIDFKKLGFHAGIEVHHQILSKRKLFCHCPAILEENPENRDYTFYRYFRPVLGEMGDFDPGMLVEFEKGYKVIYYACERNTCTYEMDETPPFFPDMEAVRKGIILALYLNCSALAEEIVVNRKQYLDGSITTGFQRTFIVGRDGWVPINGKHVRITNVYIEEDAARRVNWCETANRTVYFNLDRLGVPLTEVISDHRDVENPTELVDLAKQIGRVLRVSHIGRRGIGVARQDINLSIKGGNRVEIKGVQDLRMFDLLCRHEAVRQHALIEISREMKRRRISKNQLSHTYVDVSHIFETSYDQKAFATVFPRMKGLFGAEIQPNKDFGSDIFEKSMLITGIPREDHFHSDEMDKNAVRKRSCHPSRITLDERKIDEIRSILNLKPNDAFVLVFGPERKALHAMKKVVERVKVALDGVPQETRRLLPDGNTEFLRVIHGRERIYPDTDTPPIVISAELVKDCRKNVGKRPWEISEELYQRFGFNQAQVDLLIRDNKIDKFFEYVCKLRLDGALAYRLLIELPRQKRREGIILEERWVDELASLVSSKLINSNQIDLILYVSGKLSARSIRQMAKKLSDLHFSDSEIKALILKQLESFDASKIRSNREYRRFVLAKIAGAVLKAISYSVRGEVVLEQIKSLVGLR